MSLVQKNKGISRIDTNSTHGWFVRCYRNAKIYSKLFSDKKYGGRRKALCAAREYRDQLEKDLEKIPRTPRGRRLVFSDSRNKTGVLGVTRSKKVGADGVVREAYAVSWRPEPGVQKCTSFSIDKYGEEGAFRLAVQLRRKKMREIFGLGVLRKIKEQENSAQTLDQ